MVTPEVTVPQYFSKTLLSSSPEFPLVPRAPHIPSTPPYCPELQSPGSYTISSGALHGSTRMLSELSQVTKKEKRGK